MRIRVVAATVASHVAGTVIAWLIMNAVGYHDAALALIVGAIIGTNVAVILHHRQPGARFVTSTKLALGAILAVSAVATGLGLQRAVHCFPYPEVTLPIALLGTFVFPFAIGRTMWNALEQTRPKP